MAASIYDWSLVAANNGNSDADSTWVEGQAPSTVNNTGRSDRTRVRQLLTDIGGSLPAGGTANGLTVTAASPFTAYADGMIISFRATASNTGAATLNVNGISAKAIRKMDATGDVAIIANEIRNTGIYVAQYSAALNGAVGAWLLINPTPQIAAPAGHIFGLTLSNNTSDSANDIDIAVGVAASDDTDPIKMVLSSALGKRLDAAWTVGGTPVTALGGLDTGAVGNSVYYVWLIRRPDTGVVDALFSLSATAPTMPANYTQKQMIGSFIRVSAANNAPRSYSEKEATTWVAYTAVPVGFGAVSGLFVESRRMGDTLQIRGKYTSGTVTATEARLSIGYNGVNVNVTADATKVPTIQFAGVVIRSAAGAPQVVLLAEGALSYLTFGLQGAANGGLNKVQGTDLVSSIIYAFSAEVPIAGW